MSKPRFVVLAGMILLAAMSRLVAHPWNLTPITGMALFAGAHFSSRKAAMLIPLAALFLSDCILGFYSTMTFTYLSFGLIVLLGHGLRGHISFTRVTAASLMGSILFFVVTNFAHWAFTAQYPKSFQGLAACFTMAIPFFRNAILGDAFYSALLFGSFTLAERSLPKLNELPAS